MRCVLIDFSKAFDMVDRAMLARKLYRLQAPGFVTHWIISFLTDCNQDTKLGLSLSTLWDWYRTYFVYNVCT